MIEIEKVICDFNGKHYSLPWSLMLSLLMEYADHEPSQQEVLYITEKIHEFEIIDDGIDNQ